MRSSICIKDLREFIVGKTISNIKYSDPGYFDIEFSDNTKVTIDGEIRAYLRVIDEVDEFDWNLE